MSQNEYAQASPDGAEAAPGADQQEMSAAQNFMLVTTQSLGLIKSSIDLLGLELLLALKAVPKLIALSLGLVFFLSLAWVSFSACLSWLAFHFTGEVGAAVFCFFFVQLAAIAFVVLSMVRCKRTLTLPNSRAQAKEIAEVFHEAFRSSETKEDGGGS